MAIKMESKDLSRGRHIKGAFKKFGKWAKVFWGIFLLMFLVAGGEAIIFLKSGGEEPADFSLENMPEAEMQFSITEEMTVASGVTGVGVTEEIFEVEELTAGLEIEEVYISAEDVVEKGSKVLKLSETSIAEAREELEKTGREAELAYRAGKIEYEQSKITLEYDRDSKVLSGKQAEAVYDATLSGLQDSVDKAREELQEAEEEIAEYQSYVNDQSYKSYFKVDEYQAAYDETLEALKDRMEDWGVSWSQVTGAGGANAGGTGVSSSGSSVSDGAGTPSSGRGTGTPSSGNGASDGAGTPSFGNWTAVRTATVSGNNETGGDGTGGTTGDNAADHDTPQSTGPSSDQIQVLASLYKVLEKQAKKLEQAEDEYEDAVVNAAFELQTLELQIPELKQKVTEAEKNYETEVLQAKVTYEKALANAESAQSDYETALRKAETNYEKLKSDWEDAEENLKLFEESVGDGYFYASCSGTVLRTMVRAGEELSAEGMIFLYSNPEEMTVTVSVNQTDIADIALEEKVYIQTEEHGAFEGVVTKIDPVSDSDSRTNVTYSVVVKFIGDMEAVPANESAIAVFGMEEKAIQKAISGAAEGRRMP